MRKLPSWLWGLLGVLAAAGAFGTAALDRGQLRRTQAFALRMATSARDSARDGLRTRLEVLAGQAANAASLSQLRAHIGAFDADTLRDGFKNEPWWQPVRLEFRVYGVVLAGEALDLVEGDGMVAADLDVAPLVRAARLSRQSSGVVLARSKNWPYLVATAVIDSPGKPEPAVLVLARPLDEGIARELSSRAGGAVLLRDGRAALLAVGEGKERLLALSERGDRGGPLVSDDGLFAASRQELVPGLSLWALASVAGHAAVEVGDGLASKAVLWVLLVAAAAVGVLLARRGPTALPAPAPAEPHSGVSDPARRLMTPPDTLESESVTSVQRALTNGSNMFGRYVLIDRLGEGGMAEVYTAVAFGAENFRRTFVVKRLRPELCREQSIVSAFIDEANLASSLVHSNIVPVFDFGKVGDEYFLAQEYILGRDLGRLTRRALEREGRPLPAALVFYIAHEVLKALEYAHGRAGEGGRPLGIVHRDVSPNNILVSARGEVKLFDFGIAKAEGRLTQTQAGIVKGNVRFMSPEQARGAPIDSRADLFSLALVAYYAIAGDALYGGENSYELLMRAAQGPGSEEWARLAMLGDPAARILTRALQHDPAARFQSAAEFATALAPYLAGAAAALGRTMERLFADDIRQEEARFANAVGHTGTTDVTKQAIAIK
jgi:hypothetical protein